MKRSDLTEALARPDGAGVFELPTTEEAAVDAAARVNGFPCLLVNLAGCTEAGEVLTRFAEALQFPGWFGYTWDSLAECLTDLSWQPAAGYVLLIRHSAEFRASAEDELDTLVGILSDSSASWSGLGVPFWVFVLQ